MKSSHPTKNFTVYKENKTTGVGVLRASKNCLTFMSKWMVSVGTYKVL